VPHGEVALSSVRDEHAEFAHAVRHEPDVHIPDKRTADLGQDQGTF